MLETDERAITAMLTIRNPATAATIAELQQDNAASIGAKYIAARAAQPAW
ncbi:MAG: hypothetical protein H7X75_07160, partial [Burkholderiaceae bacterium]|nr:hypothetical protein [Burkholderiaceae bacterium]